MKDYENSAATDQPGAVVSLFVWLLLVQNHGSDDPDRCSHPCVWQYDNVGIMNNEQFQYNIIIPNWLLLSQLHNGSIVTSDQCMCPWKLFIWTFEYPLKNIFDY